MGAIWFILAPGGALAGDLRLGAATGFGGAGIAAQASVSGTLVNVQRAEGPGTYAIFVDYLVTDRLSVGAERLAGFRLAPLSSGVAFTGLDLRWYFSPAPSVAKLSPDGATLLIKKFTPFVGLGAGVASGQIDRAQDAVPSVVGSGVYVGYKLGMDYPLAPGLGLRPEMDYSKTISSSVVAPASLNLFSFQCGLYMLL